MCGEFSMVFDLCMFVIQNTEQPTLVQATLGVRMLLSS